ncbi:DUF4416 family protein [bacterium]|nr:DUF4416 family protein [bacterium]
MAEPVAVLPVKRIVAILWSDESILSLAHERLTHLFGPIDFVGTDHLFDATTFYDAEMGAPIHRRLISHQTLSHPESIVADKEATNQIETSLRQQGDRKVNLDIGYLDLHKVVLASMKPAGQKIHLARGVYADLTFRFARRGYQPLEWTFLDLRDGRYQEDFLAIRAIYREQIRQGGILP